MRYRALKIRSLVIWAVIAIIVPLSLLSAWVDFNLRKAQEIEKIDSQLIIAAHMAEYLLPENYHDRIEGPDSISKEEFSQIVNRYNTICEELRLEYLWSLLLVDGHPVFTSSTSPDKQAENGLHAKFFEPHGNPESYTAAFQNMETQYLEISDQWGKLRAVLVPRIDSQGRKYLFGASRKLSDLEALMPDLARDTALSISVILIPGLLIGLFVARWLSRPIADLAQSAKEITGGDYLKPLLVEGAYEIRVVSEQLNQMRIAIGEHVNRLTDTLSELEDFKSTINHCPLIIFSLDIQHNFSTRYISENIDRTGYTADDFLQSRVDWEKVVPENERSRLLRAYETALRNGNDTFAIDTSLILKTGEIRSNLNHYLILRDAQGNPEKLQGMSFDITERKLAEEHIRVYTDQLESTMRELSQFHGIVCGSPILIYRVKADENMTTEFISDNYSLLGYDVEKLRSGEIKWSDLIPQEDLKRVEKVVEKSLSEGSATHSTQIRIRWADGTYHWYTCWNRFIFDELKKPISIQGIMTDITDLKEAHSRDIQYQDRLKALARDLEDAEENERRRLAYILHDDIGQMLAGLNMKLSVLKETSDRKQINELANQVDELLSKIMQATKTLTWEISPTSLYESDMAAGLAYMAEEIERFFGLHVLIQTAGIRVELDQATASFIFRCSKELLVNIAKHADVKLAEIGISHYSDKVHLVVSDQGTGFDPEILEQPTRSGFGLFSIRERVEHMNGSLHIESAPGQGTKVMLILPVDISSQI